MESGPILTMRQGWWGVQFCNAKCYTCSKIIHFLPPSWGTCRIVRQRAKMAHAKMAGGCQNGRRLPLSLWHDTCSCKTHANGGRLPKWREICRNGRLPIWQGVFRWLPKWQAAVAVAGGFGHNHPLFLKMYRLHFVTHSELISQPMVLCLFVA